MLVVDASIVMIIEYYIVMCGITQVPEAEGEKKRPSPKNKGKVTVDASPSREDLRTLQALITIIHQTIKAAKPDSKANFKSPNRVSNHPYNGKRAKTFIFEKSPKKMQCNETITTHSYLKKPKHQAKPRRPPSPHPMKNLKPSRGNTGG